MERAQPRNEIRTDVFIGTVVGLDSKSQDVLWEEERAGGGTEGVLEIRHTRALGVHFSHA